MKTKPTIQTVAAAMALLVVQLVYAASTTGHTAKKTEAPALIGRPANPIVIRFDFAKADLKIGKAEEAKFAQAAQELTNFPYAKLQIDGNTDAVGPETVNEKLSEQRAEAVRRHFISKYGVDASRIVIKPHADRQPAATNATAEGRRENRRAVARVYRLEPDETGQDGHNL